MPLPPAPTKRASLLSIDAFNQKPAEISREATPLQDSDLIVTVTAPLAKPVAKLVVPSNSTRPKPRSRKVISQTATPAPLAQQAKTNLAEARTESIPEAKQAPVGTQTTQVKTTPKRTAPVASRRSARSKSATAGAARLFVLDTNVLLHDPTSLFRFEEHDIFLPMIVLEELDGHKKGMTEVARNGRQTSRMLDALVAQQGGDMSQGLKLSATGHQSARGLLFFQTEPLDAQLPSSLPQGKADNQILGVVHALRSKYPQREVILVSKDINMRVKARALGLAAEDYENDKTLEDGELLYAGALALPQDFWTRQSKTIESWASGSHTFYRVSGPSVSHFFIIREE